MPTRRPVPRSRSGRRLLPLAAVAAIAVTLVAALPAGPGLAAPTATAGPGSGATTVTGVLERVSVETERVAVGTGRQSPGHSLPAAHSATMTSWIRSGAGRVQVQPAALDGVPTGSTVTVRLDPAPDLAATAAGPSARTARPVRSVRVLSTPRVAAARPASTAPQSVTVVLALPHGARSDSTSGSALAATINTGVARFWAQQSAGRISFTVSRTVGWTALTHSCSDIWGVWDEARARSGFVPGARRHLVVYVPAGAGCPTGLGTVGDRVEAGGNVLVGGTSVGLLAHELGHNLGLGHSNALRCTGAQDGVYDGSGFGARCEVVEYGDWYDVMGISWDNLGTLSTGQAYRIGLLGAGEVRTVTSPTRVALRAVSGHSGLQSLRVQDPGGAMYVVEYRPAAGADAWLDTSADWRGLRPGVLVRRVDPADATQTLLLDPSPAPAPATAPAPAGPAPAGATGNPAASGTAADGDWDLVLAPGQSLTTGSGRVTITLESSTATTAVIAVGFDGGAPAALAVPGGRLLNGAQVTVGAAPAAWLAAAL